MSFKSEHPDYKSYESTEYYVSDLPPKMNSALQGFITRQCQDARTLKSVINDIAGRVPMEPTTNWGWDFLIEDLQNYVASLCKLPFHKIMDFFADACTTNQQFFSINDLNELLEDLDIGYILAHNRYSRTTSWILRDSVSSRTEVVEATVQDVKDICTQTLDHLMQAKEHLANTANDRDRKDAIRDCLSAMESMLKTLSGKSDIKDATSELRSIKSWGPDIIVKDGLSLWDRMHDLYPDIRHGNPKKSEITDEETFYWLERITSFIRYMSKVHNR